MVNFSLEEDDNDITNNYFCKNIYLTQIVA